MSVLRLHRAIVSVSKLDLALAFYHGVLGLPIVEAPAGLARLTIGSGPAATELMLHERPAQPSMAGVALSLRVTDVDAVVATAEAVGCTVIDRPANQAWGERQAVLTDPDGHVVCLTSPLTG